MKEIDLSIRNSK